MDGILAHPSLPVLLACAAILVFKMMVVGHLTAWRRMQRKHYLNPEDAKTFSQMEQVQAAEHPDVERALRAHRNDLESTLPFLAIAWLFLLANPGVLLANTVFILFTVFRTAFSVFYFREMQPWRSLSFLAAETCVLVMIGDMLVWALGRLL